jgi:hypothetical protein
MEVKNSHLAMMRGTINKLPTSYPLPSATAEVQVIKLTRVHSGLWSDEPVRRIPTPVPKPLARHFIDVGRFFNAAPLLGLFKTWTSALCPPEPSLEPGLPLVLGLGIILGLQALRSKFNSVIAAVVFRQCIGRKLERTASAQYLFAAACI